MATSSYNIPHFNRTLGFLLGLAILTGISVFIFGRPSAMSTPAQFVKETIEQNRVVVFSKTYCPYCRKAKAALASVGLKQDAIKVVELDLRNDGEAIQDALLELTGGRSVPRVFIDGQFIGGGDDTDALARSGNLAALLKEKGIL